MHHCNAQCIEHNCNDDVDNEATDHPAMAKCLCFFWSAIGFNAVGDDVHGDVGVCGRYLKCNDMVF